MSTGWAVPERLVARLLGTIDRSSVVMCSKVGYFAGTSRHPYEPAQMRHQSDTTLANLGVGYLDLYSFHSTDFGEADRYLAPAVIRMGG